VGSKVGEAVGAEEGRKLGLGVGALAVYVGCSVGDAVGALLGDALGTGVGWFTV